MAEQGIGSMGLGIDEDTRRVITEMFESSKEIAESAQKAGEANAQSLGYLKDIDMVQNSVVNNMRTWMGIVATMNQSMEGVLSRNKELLSTMKEITGEMKGQGAEQEKKRKMFGEVDAEAQKQGESIAKKIMNPLGTVQQELMNMLGPWGKAAMIVGGAVVGEAAKSVTAMRDITRTGGAGMTEGMGGMGNAVTMDMAMRVASTSIPFLSEKFASKESLRAGAGTMFGLGGIRGDDLVSVMQELPRKAYHMGVSFEEASALLSRLNRVLPQSSDSLLKSFDLIGNAAKAAGEKISDYEKQVVNMVVKTSVYDSSVEEATIIRQAANAALRDNRIQQAEVDKIYYESKKSGADLGEMFIRLSKATGQSVDELVEGSETMGYRRALEQSLLPILTGSQEAMSQVNKVNDSYFKDVSEGRRDVNILAGNAKELATVFNMDIDSAQKFTDVLEGVARTNTFSGAELNKAAMSFATTFAKITHDTSKDVAELGKHMAISLLPEFKNLSLSIPSAITAFGYMTEHFNMAPETILKTLKSLAALSDRIDVSGDVLLGWQKSMAQDTREMFRHPQDAVAAAGKALEYSGKIMSMGMASVSDYTKVLRTQMDVFGKSGEESVSYFSRLSRVVGDTNVRMSELSAQTEQLAKISRQYGFDQTASLNMLVLFNSALRSGAASISDLQAVMRGPGGAGTGFRAMMVDSLAQGGGQLGQMFSQTGMLGSVDILLPDIMRYIGGDRSSPALRHLARQTGGMRGQDWEKQIGSLYTSQIQEITGGEETDPFTKLSIFKRMSQQILGQDLSAYGGALQKLYKVVTGETDSKHIQEVINTMVKESADENPTVRQLSKVQQNTGDSVTFLKNIDKNIQLIAGYRTERTQNVQGRGIQRRRSVSEPRLFTGASEQQEAAKLQEMRENQTPVLEYMTFPTDTTQRNR